MVGGVFLVPLFPKHAECFGRPQQRHQPSNGGREVEEAEESARLRLTERLQGSTFLKERRAHYFRVLAPPRISSIPQRLCIFIHALQLVLPRKSPLIKRSTPCTSPLPPLPKTIERLISRGDFQRSRVGSGFIARRRAADANWPCRAEERERPG